ncbi:MAG: hypothetical protein ACI85K_001227, partial [Hyphomicrobiaceae bacterium]
MTTAQHSSMFDLHYVDIESVNLANLRLRANGLG